MTNPHRTTSPDAGGRDVQSQRRGRALIVALHGALRAIRLYPVENTAVQKSISELVLATARIVQHHDTCEILRVGDYLFVNEARLRLTLEHYAAVAYVLGLFRESGIGGVRLVVGAVPDSRAWVVFLSGLLMVASAGANLDIRKVIIADRLVLAGIASFELLPPADEYTEEPELDVKERARQTYLRSLDVTRDVMTSARLGRSPGLRRVKRAVQGVVDAILTDSSSMLGLTTLRDFDEYTFVHSVNVCILSVALGRRIGLTRNQLLDLGLAALMHDVGKARVPLDLLNKPGALDDSERAALQQHTWQGVLTLLGMPAGASRPWRAMTAAYEHHLRLDCSGYPAVRVARPLSLFSKIIAITDGFDAATSTRVYQSAPWTPADVLRGMRDNTRLGLDPVIVKAFINLTGIYPIGTLVVLDSFELALVMAPNPDDTAVSRPIVRLMTDASGNRIAEVIEYDLTARFDNGSFFRTIIRTEVPDRYGITISDYFV